MAAARARRVGVVALAITGSCATVTRSNPPLPPVNACPAHPCEAYVPATPGAAVSCAAGACVATSPVPGDLVVTIALPEDAFSGPGRTFALALSDLVKTSTPTPTGDCTEQDCVHLPGAVTLSGFYDVLPSDAQTRLHSTLVSGPLRTSLPVHVTYRALWPPGTSAPGNDALSAGLPVPPVQAQATALPAFSFLAPGPAGYPTLGFQTYLQSRLGYTQIVAVDPPYGQDFPPAVTVVGSLVSSPGEIALSLDSTASPTGPILPTFDLSRTDGTLDGWTTYLRDAATKTVLSPVKTLSGMETPDGGVVLPTNHGPPSGDALFGTELVMAPPPDQSLPSEVFSYPQISSGQETYAVLPGQASVNGSVSWQGEPVAAQVIFEATAIYAAQPSEGPSGDGGADSGIAAPGFQPQPNFEFITQVGTAADSTYSVPSLPRGTYRVVVRPDDAPGMDGAQGLVHALAIVDDFDTGDGTTDDGGVAPPPLFVPLAHPIEGTATIADGRPLGGAAVVAIPTRCAQPAGGVAVPPDSSRCMPRSAQTTTNPDGSFLLLLDPGGYTVTVEPADGSGLPWVSRTVTVPLSVPLSAPLDFQVLAPTHLQLQLADALGPLVAGAIVRLFTIPAQGPAIEVGRAITDAAGRFDMYLDPTLP
jgi:hypothetical protein